MFYNVLNTSCYWTSGVFKMLQNSQDNTRVGVSFLIKLKASGLTQWRRFFPVKDTRKVTFTEEILNRKLHFLYDGVRHVTCVPKGLETNFVDLNFKTNILKKDLILLVFVIKTTKYLCFHIRKWKTMKTLTYCFG